MISKARAYFQIKKQDTFYFSTTGPLESNENEVRVLFLQVKLDIALWLEVIISEPLT